MPKTEAKVSGACPTFFKAACRTASEGGSNGYHWAGHTLIGHVADLAPDDVEDDEWHEEVEVLVGLISARDDEAVLGWFDARLPKCMALVPRLRREAFLGGVYRKVIDEGHDILA